MDSEFWQDADHRVQRAKDLLRRSQWPEALEELRAAAELDPFNPIHHFELGRCLELLGRLEESADAFARATEIDPAEPAFLNAEGAVLLRLHRWRAACDVFTAVEKLDPSYEPAYTNRILAYCELGDHDRAEQMFYLSQHLREDCPPAFYNVGRSLAARHKHAKAIWCWRKTLELLQKQQDGDARSRSNPGSRSAPGTAQVHLRIAESLIATGRTEAARREYLQSLARDPRDFETLLALAALLLALRQFDAAGERITRTVRQNPDDPRGHLLAGRRLFAIGKLDEAAVALRRAAELDPTLPQVHLMLAKVAARVEDAADVERHCRAEMLLRPDDPRLLKDLASLLMDVGQLEDAIACLKRAVAIAPSDAAAWQNLGVAECWRGNIMQGVVASRRALKLAPGNVTAANNLALAFLEMRELDASARVLQEAQERDPRTRLLRRLWLRLRLARMRERVLGTLRYILRRPDDRL